MRTTLAQKLMVRINIEESQLTAILIAIILMEETLEAGVRKEKGI